MYRYIPSGMLQKELNWEMVNLQLYLQLQQINPYQKLNQYIHDLSKMQLKQVSLIKTVITSQGISHQSPYEYPEFHHKPADIIEELHDREYQLLQEYKSYDYFLSGTLQDDRYWQKLIDIKAKEVNMLVELRKAFIKSTQAYSTKEVPYLIEKGYKIEKVISRLSFPTSITLDDQGMIYIAEAGFAYGMEPGEGRILRLDKNGTLIEIAGKFNGPITGLIYHRGYLYMAVGNRKGNDGNHCGQIIKLSLEGKKEVIISELATCGDHFTGDIEIGPDGNLYFIVGTATNSAVVGIDNSSWRKFHPKFHDTPARDIVLNGTNYITHSCLEEGQRINITGAYKSFGEPSNRGEVIKGKLLANGVIYCCNLDGSDLRVIADGFRNPFGIQFSPFNGQLYATDNGADPRGSRQINRDWDNFWEIHLNGWYGWPDFFSGLPVTLPHFNVQNEAQPTFLLKHHPMLARQPLTRFKRHSSSNKFDFSTNPFFGHVGEVFIAQIGDMGFVPGEEHYGYKVVRLNTKTGQIRDFLVNPLAEENTQGPIRPIDAKFSSDGTVLYIVDFGILGNMKAGRKPQIETGSLWKITKK